jgi:hypothetical protein
MEDQEKTDIGPFATEIFNDLVAELTTRFPGLALLPDPDRDAVLTAVMKAAWRGNLRGVALCSYAVNAQADARLAEDPDADVFRVDMTLNVDPEPDPWADKYGEEGGGD